jgi:glycerol-3-phosphate acyltransferase PlsX
MINIAVDSMGSDNAPYSEIEGCIEASREYDVHITLVGKEEVIAPILKRSGGKGLPIEIQNATQVIAMDESPTLVLRKKKDSSIRVAAKLVRDNVASGLVSAGNTGAAMATSKMVMGMVPGVDRPALATILPTLSGHAVLLDVGANVACKPHHLVQFAVMEWLYRESD